MVSLFTLLLSPFSLLGSLFTLLVSPSPLLVEVVLFDGLPLSLAGEPFNLVSEPIHFDAEPIHFTGEPVQIPGDPVHVAGRSQLTVMPARLSPASAVDRSARKAGLRPASMPYRLLLVLTNHITSKTQNSW